MGVTGNVVRAVRVDGAQDGVLAVRPGLLGNKAFVAVKYRSGLPSVSGAVAAVAADPDVACSGTLGVGLPGCGHRDRWEQLHGRAEARSGGTQC